MKTRSVAWCVGVMALFVSLATAEAAGPLSLVASFPLPLGVDAHDLVVDGNLAYIGTDTGLTIVDIANPVPQVVASLSLGGQVLGLALKGDYVYVANRTKDFQVVDVSDPTHPGLVATRGLPSYSWDVAVKGNVAYLANFAGELYLFDITTPTNPQKFKTLGIWEWTSPGQDEANLAKLNSYVTAGNAKVTGVSITGNIMIVTGWNYGRLHYYDVADPENPEFRGTHYAPFLFRSEADPQGTVAYSLAAFGASSGIYSVTLSTLGPSFSTRYDTCTGCDYFKSTATDYGGLAVSPNGDYVVMILGKVGVVQVLDVRNPADIKHADSLPIPVHATKTGETLGVAIKGNDIFTAAGRLGLRVYRFPGLSN